MSLLLAQGHTQARHYTLGTVWDEVALVKIRLDHALADEGVILQLAAGSMFSEGAGKEFGKLVKRLRNG